MKYYWYTAVLIFILFHETSQSSQTQKEGLSCVNDYMKNISCVWWNSTDFSAQRCELQGKRPAKTTESCELFPMKGQSARTCALTFDMEFVFLDNILLSVICNGSLITTMHYTPARHMDKRLTITKYERNCSLTDRFFGESKMYSIVKTQPPDKPTVSGINITWSRGKHFPNDVVEYEFQVQFKTGLSRWELIDTWDVSHGTYMELDINKLNIGEEYQARVRVKPKDKSNFQGEWSNWSPTVSWRSEVGTSVTTTNLPSPSALPDNTRTILIIGFNVLFIIIVISLIIFKANKSRGLLKPKNQHVPDPSRYFQPLHTIHGGNFRKWLGCQNSVGPFLNPQTCDDISPIEVSDIWDVSLMDPKSCMSTAVLLHSNQVDSGLENSGTSHASSSGFSNMGYLYTKSYSGSMHLETCPVYFSYHPEEDANSAFSSSGSSYDRLQSPSFQMNDTMSPDSGFHMPEEEQYKDKDDEEDNDTDGNALVSFIMSLPQGSLGSVQTVHSFPPMPIITPWCEPVNLPSFISTSEPAESVMVRPSSLIEPCASGYLTLKEMQKYSNKSI